jgi:hypothetical protein
VRVLAISWPSSQEVEDGAKTVAAVGGVLGGAWALVTRWRRRCAEARTKREIEAKATRYLLDAMRHTLNLLAPGEARFVDLEELARQKVLIDQVRDLLWVADGHRSEREAQRQTEEIVKVLTRTQAIRAKERPSSVFADNWTPDQGGK